MKETLELLLEANRISDEVRRLTLKEDKWELCKSWPRNGITIYRTKAKQGTYVFKGDCLVNGSAERIFDMVHPSTDYYKLQWDPNVSKVDILHELSHDTLVTRFHFKPLLNGIISQRDSVDTCKLYDGDDYKSVELGSVRHDLYPASSDYVRCWNYHSGVVIFKTDNPNICHVSVIYQSDMQVKMLPQSFLDSVTPQMIKFYLEALQSTERLSYTPLKDVPGRRKKLAAHKTH